MVQLAVVKAGEQVGRPGAARRQAHSEFAGELGVRDRHEGSHFFVPDLDKFDVVRPLQRTDHAVDAVAWITVNAPDPPSMQSFNDEITDFHLKTPDLRGAMRSPRSNRAFLVQPRNRRGSWLGGSCSLLGSAVRSARPRQEPRRHRQPTRTGAQQYAGPRRSGRRPLSAFPASRLRWPEF